MRPPRESEKLYDELKTMIATRRLPPGVQLPSEPELAAKFKTARNTLRRAMRILEEEGVLERHPGKGTFVVSDGEAPRINFPIPYPGFGMDWKRSGAQVRELLRGANLAAADMNCRLVTVPVSRKSESAEFDAEALKNVHPCDMVLLASVWFSPVFEELSRRGCKVAFVHRQSFHVKKYASFMRGWTLLEMNRIDGMRRAVSMLRAAGCGRIALVHPFLDEEEPPVVTGYRRGIAGRQEEYILNQPAESVPQLGDFYRRSRFDGLVVSGVCFPLWVQGNVNAVLDIPPEVKVILWEADDLLCLEGAFGKMAFPAIQIGYDAVRMLVSGQAAGKKYEAAWFI